VRSTASASFYDFSGHFNFPRMNGYDPLIVAQSQLGRCILFPYTADKQIDELFGLKMGADDRVKKWQDGS
jgi:hypothetical protein